MSPDLTGSAREREYDGRRFGSYAMYPLRGARAAGLVLGVKAHTVRGNVKSVGSSDAGNRGVTWRSSYLPVLEPVRWCLEDDMERQKWVSLRSRLVQLSNVRVRRVGSHTKLHHRLQHACVRRRTLGPLKLAKANYLANVSKCDPRHANDLGPEHPSPTPRCTAVRTRADSRGGSTPRVLDDAA